MTAANSSQGVEQHEGGGGAGAPRSSRVLYSPFPEDCGAVMKILVLASWFRPGAGGAFVHLSEIYKRLPHRIVVAGDRQPGDETGDAALEWKTIRIPAGPGRSLGKLGTAASLWRDYRRVREIADAEKPDLIHAGHYLPWGLYASWLERSRGTPYALFAWGEDVLAARQDRLRRAALRRAAGGARWLFTNSEFTSELLRAAGAPAERIHTVWGGVDLTRFHPEAGGEALRRRLGLENALVLLSVGALRPQQGVDRLLESVARLAPRFPALHYVVAGKGSYQDILRRRADELGLAGRVRFAGYVPDAELPAYYDACDVFSLLHRRVEETGEEMCFGLVFLEAGACGKPVVGSRVGGIHYAIRDNVTGYLVDPGAPAAADEALARLLADADLRRRLGGQARSWIEATFSWDRAAQLVRRAHGW